MLILIAALIIDTITSVIYDLISKEMDSSWGLIFFLAISAIILSVGLVLLLGDIKKLTEHVRTTNSIFNKLYKLTVAVQFVLIAIFIFMAIQIVSTSQYFVPLLVVNSVVSSIPFYISFGLLAQRFFSWYRSSNKHNVIVFLYGIAIGLILIGNAVLDTGVESEFSNAPMVKKSSAIQSRDDLSINNWSHLITPTTGNLLNLAAILLITDYLFLWIISAVLLYKHSLRIGKSNAYWMVVFLPPLFVLIGQLHTFIGIPNTNFTFYEQNAVLLRILSTLATIAGGLLFGLSFLALARTVRQMQQNVVADYLDIAGYGIALLILPIIANILFIPYPPFGIASCSSLALASYIFYVGLYSSAISISEDAQLRKSIRRTAVDELKLLDSIGTAQMSTKLEGKVSKLVKEYSDKIVNETGVQPDLSEEDAKQYLDEVLKEIDKHRNPK
jgi:hypothetical protein